MFVESEIEQLKVRVLKLERTAKSLLNLEKLAHKRMSLEISKQHHINKHNDETTKATIRAIKRLWLTI